MIAATSSAVTIKKMERQQCQTDQQRGQSNINDLQSVKAYYEPDSSSSSYSFIQFHLCCQFHLILMILFKINISPSSKLRYSQDRHPLCVNQRIAVLRIFIIQLVCKFRLIISPVEHASATKQSLNLIRLSRKVISIMSQSFKQNNNYHMRK